MGGLYLYISDVQYSLSVMGQTEQGQLQKTIPGQMACSSTPHIYKIQVTKKKKKLQQLKSGHEIRGFLQQ